MSINNITGLSGPTQRSNDVGAGRGSRSADAGKGATPTPAADSVTLSEGSARLREMTEQLAGMPAVDSARVEQLRQAIADGSYQPDSERIADKMLSMEAQLFS